MAQNSEQNYVIGGVNIAFPYKAYPSQISMMDKIVKSLVKKQNSLLESPTGSGKSLALLCSCLAWQNKTKKEMDEIISKLENNVISTVGICESSCSVESFLVNSKTIEKSSNLSELNSQTNTIPTKKELGCSEFPCSAESPKTWVKERSNNVKPPEPLFIVEGNQCSEDKKRLSNHKVQEDSDFKPSKRYRKSGSPRELKSNTFLMKNQLDHNPNIMDIPNHALLSPTFVEIPDVSSSRGLLSTEHVMKNESISYSAKMPKVFLSSNNEELFANSTFSSPEDSPKFNWLNKESKTNATADESYFEENCDSNTAELGKTPKIYFGTRTHKQITQIIRELKKTCYKDVKMTILSSRERTCIHKDVSRMENKNEGCEELLKSREGIKCSFYPKSQKVSHFNLSTLSCAWDLEDLVTSCKLAHACPYYSSRNLLKSSDIVFCPYNYLIDPLIRSSMDITLKNSVVIMDEAHNIEDFARDAASFTASQTEIIEAMDDLEFVALNQTEVCGNYYSIRAVLSGLTSWLSKNTTVFTDYNTFDMSSKVWAGEEMIAILINVGAGPEKFPEVRKNLNCILDTEADVENDKPKLKGKTCMLLKSLFMCLSYMYRSNQIYMLDYRCVMEKVAKKLHSRSERHKGGKNSLWDLKLNFWCLNPAVSFSDFKESVRSLIVASGTLSPIESFQSELSMPFTIRLEAKHVVSKSQMWVGTISKGPKGLSLNAVFNNTETFSFQDEIGMLVLKICTIVPHGVLCFLPSYSMLDKLTTRWQLTGLWDEILCKKVIVCEPRGQNQHFETVLKEFYESIKVTDVSSGINGALFIAVFRGKVSEGLDFTDNNARAVITVGIPFPNIKDIQVDLKKKYNDIHSPKRQLMSGRQWYETQAFRALNQALGRCIRHRNDFGALVIVDERFQMYPRYIGALSKWIQKEVIHYSTFNSAEKSLEDFVKRTGLSQCLKSSSEEL